MNEAAGTCPHCGQRRPGPPPGWQRLLVISATATVTFLASRGLLDLLGVL